MKLNGWQRLWILLSTVSFFIVVASAIDFRYGKIVFNGGSLALNSYITVMLIVWILAVVFIYFLGIASIWIYHGFKSKGLKVKLNGWMRLWILLSIVHSSVIAGLVGYTLLTGAGFGSNNLVWIFITWLFPIVSVYLLGLGVSWVYKGFKLIKK